MTSAPHTLLLADDSVTIQRVIELTFAGENVRVVSVGDGDQAIVQVEEHPPDIVLADVSMPGKNGYEVASYIKRSERLAHIPVLLLTGAFEPVDQRRADESRCDGVLAKPFEPHFLIARVKELLGPPGARTVAATTAPTVVIPLPTGETKPASASGADNGGAAGETSLDVYLDQLDAALADPVSARTGSPSISATASEHPVGKAATPRQEGERDTWGMSFEDGPGEAGNAPAVVTAPPQIQLPVPSVPPSGASSPISTAEPAAPQTSIEPAAPQTSIVHDPGHAQPALPALAEAFAALLAAEEGAPPPPADVWPAQPLLTDDFVEAVVGQVLERLSDRVVRETVRELVSTVAERLVREEIERIKGSIS